LENESGIYFTIKESYGLECWIPNMEDGGTWMTTKEFNQPLNGGMILALYTTIQGRITGSNMG